MRNNMMTHQSHPEHALEMIDSGSRFQCNGCKMDGVGKRYTCERRDFCLHPCCMFTQDKITIEKGTYSFFKSPRPPVTKCRKADCTRCGRSCDACGMTILGFVYHCPKNDEDFHPTCFQLLDSKPDIFANFLLKQEATSRCAICKKNLPEGAEKKIPGWFFVLENKNLNIHVYCMMEIAIELHNSSSKSNNGLLLPLKTKAEKNSKAESVLKVGSCSSKSNIHLSPALKGTEVHRESKSKKISKADLVKESHSLSSKSNKDLPLELKGTTEVLAKTKSKKFSKTESVVKAESSSSKNNKDLSPALKRTELLPESKSKEISKSKSKKISKTESVVKAESSSSKNDKDLSPALKRTELLPGSKSKKISKTKLKGAEGLPKTKSAVKLQSSPSKSNEDLPSTSKGTEVVVKNKSNKVSKTKPKKTSKTKKVFISVLMVFVDAFVSTLLGGVTTTMVSTIVSAIFGGLQIASG